MAVELKTNTPNQQVAKIARSGAPVVQRSQVAHFAQPLSSAPPAQGAFSARGVGWADTGCPRGGGQARFYAFLGRTEPVTSELVITSTVPVCHRDASLLFDRGLAYSYVSSYFVPYLDISRDSLSSPIYVSTALGDSIVMDRVYRSCLVVIGGFETRVDLLLVSMVHFDVILGMDWLSPYHAILDCHAKNVTLATPGLPRLECRGALDYVPSRVISFLKAQRMVEKGCDAYLAFVRVPVLILLPLSKF
ncbi:uncharacterized protein [Nicotiana tomentosiformis]|uniref:uncharacterized protein n=1 Tax=Nicotiana tomentosiformis TaxID=4098 RepID=UPI00388CA725